MKTDHRVPQRDHFLRSTLMFVALAALSLTVLHSDEGVQFPDGFRLWVHVGTGVILPSDNPMLKSEEGMHHVFANAKAADAYGMGDFPDGSVLVYELRDAQQKNGVISEGERRRVDVMIKDSNLYKSTGGWRFERFFGDQKAENAIKDSGNSCFQCHSKADKHGFVFSQLH
jgi:Cytochrome P460